MVTDVRPATYFPSEHDPVGLPPCGGSAESSFQPRSRGDGARKSPDREVNPSGAKVAEAKWGQRCFRVATQPSRFTKVF